MSKLTLLSLTAIVGIGFINGSLGWAQGVLHSATGSGGLWDPLWGGEYRSFAFTAVQHSDGTTTGELELKNRYQQVVIHMRVESLFVNDNGKVAGIAGTITKCDADPIRVGNWGACAVSDNGEGKNAPPDQISGLYWYYADPNNFPWSTDILAWAYADYFWWEPGAISIFNADNGSIQVR